MQFRLFLEIKCAASAGDRFSQLRKCVSAQRAVIYPESSLTHSLAPVGQWPLRERYGSGATVKIIAELRRGLDNQSVPATLLSLTPKHIEDFDTRWWPFLAQASQADKYWDWRFKQQLSERRDNYEGYAVECEGITQGLMALEMQQHRSVLDPGEPLVYVALLSAAPWNRTQLQNPPEFKRVGTLLLNFSRIRSLALGYKGRVGLHALPNAESFYERQNMTRFDFPADAYVDDEEPLPYFEYPPRRR